MEITQFIPTTTQVPSSAFIERRTFANLQSDCVEGVALTTVQCASLDNAVSSCTQLLGSDTGVPTPTAGPFAECFCQQDVSNNIIGCQNEYRQCVNGYLFDPHFSSLRSDWKSFCSSAYPYSMFTTATEITITASAGVDVCYSIAKQCSIYSQLSSVCDEAVATYAETQSSSLALKDCRCKDNLVLAESICLYDGNSTCADAQAHRSDLWGYRNCPTWLGAVSTSDSANGWQRGETTTTKSVDSSNHPFAGYSLSFSALETNSAVSESGPIRRAPGPGLLGVAVSSLCIILLALGPTI